MKHINSKMVAICAAAVFAGVVGSQTLNAQQAPSIKRNLVLKQDMEVPGRRENPSGN
jgi:hypothetical protein